MTRDKAISILSGGLDSVVSLAVSRRTLDIVFAITFDYGQLASEKEIQASRSVSQHYGIEHMVIDLPFWKNLGGIHYLENSNSMPVLDLDSLQDPIKSSRVAQLLWVPNRNGVFINVAAVFAESRDIQVLITGFNREEGQSFPDNSVDFLEKINGSLRHSTMKNVKVEAPTIQLCKKEIVELGMELDVPFQIIHSCYLGHEKMCGVCPSCARCKEAFKQAGSFHLIKERFQDAM